MRILWVGHNLAYPPVRGVLQRNYNLLRQAATKSEIQVLAFDQPATRPPGVSVEDCIEALQKFCVHVEWVPLPSGAFRSRYGLGLRGLLSPNAYDLNWLASKFMTARLERTINLGRFDTIHFDTLGLAQYGSLAGDVGTVLNHHNVESSMMRHRAANETNHAARLYWQWEAQKLLQAERHYCPRFSVNLVVSAEDENVLSERVPGVKTRVVANGVDTEYFTPRADPGGEMLLFCGGMDWYPNSEAMAYFFDQIWARLTRLLPEVRLIVVGRNPPKWLIQRGASDHRVCVTGFVEDVRPYFSKATAYVCPIRTGGGTRLKILDALAMGMPIVSTTFACSGIAAQDGRHVLLADNPEHFVNQVLRVLRDPLLRRNLGACGRELVCQEYSWSVIGSSLLLAYREASFSGQQKSAPLVRLG